LSNTVPSGKIASMSLFSVFATLLRLLCDRRA
jgi:hypothetical protein